MAVFDQTVWAHSFLWYRFSAFHLFALRFFLYENEICRHRRDTYKSPVKRKEQSYEDGNSFCMEILKIKFYLPIDTSSSVLHTSIRNTNTPRTWRVKCPQLADILRKNKLVQWKLVKSRCRSELTSQNERECFQLSIRLLVPPASRIRCMHDFLYTELSSPTQKGDVAKPTTGRMRPTQDWTNEPK